MKEGNKVQLISGSHPMTIESIDGSYVICVYWDTNTQKVIREKIGTAALKIV